MKLLALSKEYFACGWNIFDLLIVSASLLDLSFELVGGLSVLRGLRLVGRDHPHCKNLSSLDDKNFDDIFI